MARLIIGYHEGFLQLRNPTHKLLEYLRNKATRDHQEIVKQRKVEGGHDFYYKSRRYLLDTGQKLKRIFPGRLRVTRRLMTRDFMTAKNIYRMTVLFKMPSFKAGDTVKLHGSLVNILELQRKVHVQETISGRKRWCSYDEFDF